MFLQIIDFLSTCFNLAYYTLSSMGYEEGNNRGNKIGQKTLADTRDCRQLTFACNSTAENSFTKALFMFNISFPSFYGQSAFYFLLLDSNPTPCTCMYDLIYKATLFPSFRHFLQGMQVEIGRCSIETKCTESTTVELLSKLRKIDFMCYLQSSLHWQSLAFIQIQKGQTRADYHGGDEKKTFYQITGK